MAKYRKKPVVIEAIELRNANKHELLDRFTPNEQTPLVIVSRDDSGIILYAEITTREGTMRADIGDFIIKGVQGELYPCKPDIFAATYDAVE